MESVSFALNNMVMFLGEHPILAYAILFLGSFSETISGPGFFIYGELFFIPGAILAGAGVLDIWLVALACISGGILGDFTSFNLGKHFGSSLFKKGNKVFSPENHELGHQFFDKHGPKALFFARLLGPMSWITPFLAGTYKIPVKTYLTYNIPGVCVGIGEFLLVGYFFGSNYKTALYIIQKDMLYVFGGLLFLFLLYYIIDRNKPDFFTNTKNKIKNFFI